MDFRDLYKNTSQIENHQSQRRVRLLEQQRKQRENEFSFRRDLKNILSNRKTPGKNRINDMFRNILMLSEWLMARPGDIEEFFIKPCPKGVRCSLSTGENKSKVAKLYFKNGMKHFEVKTNLPAYTILDVIYNEASQTIFVLDMIAYGDRDMIDTDASFRFFWLKSKFEEDDLRITDSEKNIKFDLIMTYDFLDSSAVRSCFQDYPIFSNAKAELDGFLFYHKDASYTAGQTPLVLWLFPFMVDELFEIKVNPCYHATRPDNYTNYLDYIKEFDIKMKQRKGKKQRNTSDSMEHEMTDATNDDSRDEMQAMIELEMTGNDVE